MKAIATIIDITAVCNISISFCFHMPIFKNVPSWNTIKDAVQAKTVLPITKSPSHLKLEPVSLKKTETDTTHGKYIKQKTRKVMPLSGDQSLAEAIFSLKVLEFSLVSPIA